MTPEPKEVTKAREALTAADSHASRVRSADPAEGSVFAPKDIAAFIGVSRDHLRATLAHIDTLTARLAEVERERDEARAYMPKWSRTDTGYALQFAGLTVAGITVTPDTIAPNIHIEPGRVRMLTKADDIEAAARSICAALRIPYVPEGL